MARLIDILTFSGTVGDMVGCKGPHGFYIRSRPRKSNKVPTPKQLESRAKLALAMEFLKPLKAIVYSGFAADQTVKTKVSAMNAAVSHVINHAVTGDYPDLKIDPAQVRLSRGRLLGLPDAESRITEAGVEVIWSAAVTSFNGYADDRVVVVVYNAAEKVALAGETRRDVGTLTVDISDEPFGSELLIYACAADREGKHFSNSQFLGAVTR